MSRRLLVAALAVDGEDRVDAAGAQVRGVGRQRRDVSARMVAEEGDRVDVAELGDAEVVVVVGFWMSLWRVDIGFSAFWLTRPPAPPSRASA
ncbi:MAG: hypothetical protein KY438_04005 [Actinobacteria bacterium]|nr:hypothetical protein [Actinomycetota bacterium]